MSFNFLVFVVFAMLVGGLHGVVYGALFAIFKKKVFLVIAVVKTLIISVLAGFFASPNL